VTCTGCYGQVVAPVDAAASMLQVARVFSRALLVVAPHGGTLANLLFSQGSSKQAVEPGRATDEGGGWRVKQTRVLELLPANRPNLCFERLCRSLGLHYMGLVVPDTIYNQPMRVHVPRVLVALQALLSS
jgi:capsular polysaccharide biosynthesis protein